MMDIEGSWRHSRLSFQFFKGSNFVFPTGSNFGQYKDYIITSAKIKSKLKEIKKKNVHLIVAFGSFRNVKAVLNHILVLYKRKI